MDECSTTGSRSRNKKISPALQGLPVFPPWLTASSHNELPTAVLERDASNRLGSSWPGQHHCLGQEPAGSQVCPDSLGLLAVFTDGWEADTRGPWLKRS